MTFLINDGLPLDMVAIIKEEPETDIKYNLIVLDHYDIDYMNEIYKTHGNQIKSVSFYKHGEIISLNGHYIDINLPNIYVNINGITMYDFVVGDKDIVYN